MRSLIIALLSLSVLFGCDDAKKKLGLGPTEADKKAAEEEKKAAVQRLKDGDAQITAWLDKIGQRDGKVGGFVHWEGVTDADPWGNLIRVEYGQEWFNETMAIRSAGPDGQLNSPDDIVKVRTAPNPFGIFSGLPWWGWAIIIWIGCAILSTWFSHVYRNSRRRHNKPVREPTFAGAMVRTAFAPIAFIGLGLGALLGGVFDWDIDLPSFDGGFDLDFD